MSIGSDLSMVYVIQPNGQRQVEEVLEVFWQAAKMHGSLVADQTLIQCAGFFSA